MSVPQTSFYVSGGTLRADSPSYVEREADRDLYEGLIKGEFCYVLTSRQMGKSSLMVRTANRLRACGLSVAALDLTAIGQNLTPDQWSDGLMARLGRQLRLEDDLEGFWSANRRFSPVQRFFLALREIVLTKCRGTVVVFVDELDVVRSLPFSTDEFFAAVRECYTCRTEDAELNRLTFCLLGVATPTQLIRDVNNTPFNIGRRIELCDFTRAEMSVLTAGLLSPRQPEARRASELLDRVYAWTHGHPYLTQRLCRAAATHLHSEVVAEPAPEAASQAGATALINPGTIDSLCVELFLSPRARELDDHLLYLRERLLRGGGDQAALLRLYLRVHGQRRVRDDENNELIKHLHLAGIVRAENGILVVRNRIYEQVFDKNWAHSVGALNRPAQQRAASKQRLALAGVIGVAALAWLLRGGMERLQDRGVATPLVAVLPFEYRGPNPTNQSLVEGLSGVLADSLANLTAFGAALRVVPVADLSREGVRTARRAREVFGVDRVLSGTVEQDQNRLRINIYLLEARTFRRLTNSVQEVALGNFAEAQHNLVLVPASWFQLSRTSGAETILREGQTQDPQAAEWYARGLGHLNRAGKLSDFESAVEALRIACGTDPAFALAHAQLGEALLLLFERTRSTNWFAEAEQHAIRATELGPKTPQAFVTLGQIYQRRGQLREAGEAFQKALALDSRNAAAMNRLAFVEESLNHPREAEKLLRKAVELSPKHWASYSGLGTFYYHQGRYREAESCFAQVAKLAPDSPHGLAYLGGIYHLLGRLEDAKATLRRSLEKSETAEGHSNLGTVLFFEGKYRESAESFVRARELLDSDPVIWGNLADAWRFTGKGSNDVANAYRRAAELASADLAINPRDFETRGNYAVYLAWQHEVQPSIREIERALAEAPGNVNLLFLSALVYEISGNHEAALGGLKAALDHGYSLAEVERHPDLETLRKDTRFASLRQHAQANRTQ